MKKMKLENKKMIEIERAIEYFYNRMNRGLIENDTQQEIYEIAISELEDRYQEIHKYIQKEIGD